MIQQKTLHLALITKQKKQQVIETNENGRLEKLQDFSNTWKKSERQNKGKNAFYRRSSFAHSRRHKVICICISLLLLNEDNQIPFFNVLTTCRPSDGDCGILRLRRSSELPSTLPRSRGQILPGLVQSSSRKAGLAGLAILRDTNCPRNGTSGWNEGGTQRSRC